MTTKASPVRTGSTTDQATSPMQYLDAEGIRFAYRVREAHQATTQTPLVLLQRFRGTLDDWDPAFLDASATDRSVVTFNNAGVASSSGTVPNTVEGMADDAATFIRALASTLDVTQVDILGWSMSGFVAQALALRHSGLVRRMVLLGTGPAGKVVHAPQDMLRADHPPLEEVFEVAARPAYEGEEHQYLFFADAPESAEARRASLERIQGRPYDLEGAVGSDVIQPQYEAIAAWIEQTSGYFEQLRDIQQPTLIVSGDRDVFFPVVDALLLYRDIPNARLAIYPMAGHGPHHQHPERVAETVHDFLSAD